LKRFRNKKLSYLRDSARRRFRLSSVKVTDFGVIHKQLSSTSGQIIAFDKNCLSLMQSFSVISANITRNHILLKTRFLDYIFVSNNVVIFNYFDVIGPQIYRFGRMTLINGHYAIQGHSRSLILVSFESSYMRLPISE